MFELVSEQAETVGLSLAAGELFVACATHLNHRREGSFQRLPTNLVALDEAGVETGQRAPASVAGVFGRFPDRAWISVSLGWEWVGGPRGSGSPVPLMAAGRWDGTRWVERAGVTSLVAWTDAAIVATPVDRRWADPDDRPVPAGLLKVAGEHVFARAFDGRSYSWGHYPPGASVEQKLDAAFATSEHVLFATGPSRRVYAVGADARGPFAFRSEPSEEATLGSWQMLPPPPGAPLAAAIAPDESPWLIVASAGPPPVGATTGALFRLRGRAWEPVALPFAARAAGVVSADGALWIAADASSATLIRWLLLEAR